MSSMSNSQFGSPPSGTDGLGEPEIHSLQQSVLLLRAAMENAQIAADAEIDAVETRATLAAKELRETIAALRQRLDVQDLHAAVPIRQRDLDVDLRGEGEL